MSIWKLLGLSSSEVTERKKAKIFINLASPFWRGLIWGTIGLLGGQFIFAPSKLLSEAEEQKPFRILQPLMDAQEGPEGTGITFCGRTSTEFQEKILERWKDFPEAIKIILELGQYQIRGGPTHTENLPFLKDLTRPFNEDNKLDPRKYPNQISGFCASFHVLKVISISEYMLSIREDQDQSKKFSVKYNDFINGEWILVREQVPQTLSHEIGHAFDNGLKNLMGIVFSDTDAFKRAVQADLSVLDMDNRQYNILFSYMKDDKWLRGELFAEAMAHLYGGSEFGPEFSKDWANAVLYVENLVERFCGAYVKGLDKLMFFIDGLDGQSPEPTKVRKSVSDAWLKILRGNKSYKEEDFIKWAKAAPPLFLKVMKETIAGIMDESNIFGGTLEPNDQKAIKALNIRSKAKRRKPIWPKNSVSRRLVSPVCQ